MKNGLPFKYIPKLFTSILFLVLLAAAMLLFWGRKKVSLRPSMLLQFDPDFYQHVSNFSISYLLYVAIGYLWLLLGAPFKFIAMLGSIILAVNIIYELYIPILNTPDTIDAWYGIAGTLLAFAFLLLIQRFGLKNAD